jgi:hypothetical protein
MACCMIDNGDVIRCGALLHGLSSLVLLGVSHAGTNVLLAHGHSVFKHVWDEPRSVDVGAEEKAWNGRGGTGFLLDFQVPTRDLSKDGVKEFKRHWGCASRSNNIRLADVRAIYVFCLRRIGQDRVRSTESKGQCRGRLTAWALGIAANAHCHQWLGAVPFTSADGMHASLAAELFANPVNLPVVQPASVPRAAPPVPAIARPAADAQVPRQPVPPTAPTTACYDGAYALPADIEDGDPPAAAPVTKEARASASTKYRKRRIDTDCLVMTTVDIEVSDKDGGVDIPLLKRVMAIPRLEVAVQWQCRVHDRRDNAPSPVVESQLRNIQRWAKRPGSEGDVVGVQRGAIPDGCPSSIAADSSTLAVPRHAWNAIAHALVHREVAAIVLKAGEGETTVFACPRFEHLAASGVWSAVLQCYHAGGTSRSSKPKAAALHKLMTSMTWILCYLWNRLDAHREEVAAGDNDLARLQSRLQSMITQGRRQLKDAVDLSKSRQAAAVTNTQRRDIIGDVADVHAPKREVTQQIVGSSPGIVHGVLTDLAKVAFVAEARRLNGLPPLLEHAEAMADVLIRVTAMSFVLPHIRPSIVEETVVYLTTERTPPCSDCTAPDCKGAVILVDPVECVATWQAPHHKAVTGGKRSSLGKAIVIACYHKPTVTALREWALSLNAVLYHGAGEPGTGEGVPRRFLFRMYRPVKGAWEQLRAGESSALLRQASALTFGHSAYRPANVTVLKGTRLAAHVLAGLKERLASMGVDDAVPDHVDDSVARCMGNSRAMWAQHYDAATGSKDARVTAAVMDAVRAMLLLHHLAGERFRENALPELTPQLFQTPDPERDIMEHALQAALQHVRDAQAVQKGKQRASNSVAATSNIRTVHASGANRLGDWDRGSSDSDTESELQCEACSRSDGADTIVVCDNLLCSRGWHLSCLQPPLVNEPADDWRCPDCQEAKRRRIAAARPLQPPAGRS